MFIEIGSKVTLRTSLSLHNSSLIVTSTKAARRIIRADIDYTIIFFDSLDVVPDFSTFNSIAILPEASQCEVITVHSAFVNPEGLHLRFNVNRSQCESIDLLPPPPFTGTFPSLPYTESFPTTTSDEDVLAISVPLNPICKRHIFVASEFLAIVSHDCFQGDMNCSHCALLPFNCSYCLKSTSSNPSRVSSFSIHMPTLSSPE